jgi:hypothetical protein
MTTVAKFLRADSISRLITTSLPMFKNNKKLLVRGEWFWVPVCTCRDCRPGWAYLAPARTILRQPPTPTSPYSPVTTDDELEQEIEDEMMRQGHEADAASALRDYHHAAFVRRTIVNQSHGQQ